MAFILSLILAAVLFILYKAITGNSLPNIKFSFNANRKNSANIKNSFNTNISMDNSTKIDNSTHNQFNFSNSTNSNNSHDIIYVEAAIFVISILLGLKFYKSYYTQINIAIICSPLIILVLYLLATFIFKSKDMLNDLVIKYMATTLFLTSVVIIFYFFPIYKGAGINSLLSSEINISILKNISVNYIVLGLLGCIFQILSTVLAFIQLIRNYNYRQIKFNYKYISFTTLFSFLATSGVFVHVYNVFSISM
ncbi:hypothetical protein [Clostridium botulinum]|uniref:hypothetical protein n=1 Tax=Clostridium botulinum TaxID=1491 RepID=UPI003DA1D5F4